MKYLLGHKIKKQLKRYIFILPLAFVGLTAGLYILSIPMAPKFVNNHAVEAAKSDPQPDTDKIIIPSADINTQIYTGGAEALHKGAWHRFPDRGDPEKGGNFIISGHRFVMSYSPIKTMNESYFYNVSKVKEGDKVVVHWHGKKYEYQVTKKYTVKPQQTDIEDPSSDAKLTIYTCTLGGTYDGRVVLEATPKF
ncbi:MAG TPA: sortase [Candidatus Saccharimonadales bacterium]|nr:sortase [Candidatus Saccharimonadales bacterium]